MLQDCFLVRHFAKFTGAVSVPIAVAIGGLFFSPGMEAAQNGVDLVRIRSGLHGKNLHEPSVKLWIDTCAGKIRVFSDAFRQW
jgi:hypothetical protein